MTWLSNIAWIDTLTYPVTYTSRLTLDFVYSRIVDILVQTLQHNDTCSTIIFPLIITILLLIPAI